MCSLFQIIFTQPFGAAVSLLFTAHPGNGRPNNVIYVCVPCAEQSPADRFLIDYILAAALFDSVMLFTSCRDNTKPMRQHLDNLYHYSTSKNELQ